MEYDECTAEEYEDYISAKADMQYDQMKEQELFSKSDNKGELL